MFDWVKIINFSNAMNSCRTFRIFSFKHRKSQKFSLSNSFWVDPSTFTIDVGFKAFLKSNCRSWQMKPRHWPGLALRSCIWSASVSHSFRYWEIKYLRTVVLISISWWYMYRLLLDIYIELIDFTFRITVTSYINIYFGSVEIPNQVYFGGRV